MEQEKPILHGQEFGTPTGYYPQWAGKFLWMGDATWAFVFIDDKGKEEWRISGTGNTPRSAFEECIQCFVALNEGVESPTLKEILPRLREFFNDEGGVKLEHLLALR